MVVPRAASAIRKLLIGVGVLFLGCGGGPHYDGNAFRSDELAFRIGPPPASWRALESDEALLAFRDDASRATIAVNGRCHRDGDDVPLQALTHHLFLQFTDRELVEREELQLDDRAALRTELVARLDGVPKHFTVYVLKKNGCVYDFLHIADVHSEGAQRDFRSFVRSFRAVRP